MTPDPRLERCLAALPARYRDAELRVASPRSLVLAAEDGLLGRPVTLKFLVPSSGEAAPAERFLREARVLAGLDHPGVVRVHDLSQGPPSFLVMERLEGESLADTLARTGSLEPEEAAEVTASVLATLAHLHRAGVVHRCLAPEHVFRCRDGRLVLLDFGLARVRPELAATLAGDLSLVPGYAAPEQLAAGEVGPAADLFAVGALLYTALCGRPPFGTAAQLGAPPGPRTWTASPTASPAPLRRLLADALSPDPAARPASAADFRRRLADALPRRERDPLVDLAALRAAARDVLHPLKNQLGLGRRHRGDPARMTSLLSRPRVRDELEALLDRARRALGRERLWRAPGTGVEFEPARAAGTLGHIEDCLLTLDPTSLPDALDAGWEVCRAALEVADARVRPHLLDLGTWARRAAGSLGEAPARLELAPGADSPREVLAADPGELARELDRALWTLVTNAAEAGAGRVELHLSHDGDEVRIEVRDDGEGLPPGDPERCFARGGSTKEGGSGYGLADARAELARHGVHLRALPGEPGAGARFELRVPVGPDREPGGSACEP